MSMSPKIPHDGWIWHDEVALPGMPAARRVDREEYGAEAYRVFADVLREGVAVIEISRGDAGISAPADVVMAVLEQSCPDVVAAGATAAHQHEVNSRYRNMIDLAQQSFFDAIHAMQVSLALALDLDFGRLPEFREGRHQAIMAQIVRLREIARGRMVMPTLDLHTADAMRQRGWIVTAHYDRMAGTSWMFTKGNHHVVGEARTDTEALEIASAKADRIDAENVG